jgi:hypothetical protein
MQFTSTSASGLTIPFVEQSDYLPLHQEAGEQVLFTPKPCHGQLHQRVQINGQKYMESSRVSIAMAADLVTNVSKQLH